MKTAKGCCFVLVFLSTCTLLDRPAIVCCVKAERLFVLTGPSQNALPRSMLRDLDRPPKGFGV